MHRRHWYQAVPVTGLGSMFPAFLAVLVALLLTLVIYQIVPPLQLTITRYDRNFLSGVHDIEQIDGNAARWTTAAAEVALPRLSANHAAIATLRLLNARPPGQPEPSVQIGVDRRDLVRFTVPRSDSGRPYRYRIIAPPGAGPQTAIAITVDTIRPPEDARDLGIVLLGVGLEASQGGLQSPSLITFIVMAILAGCSYGAFRGSNLAAVPALGITTLLMVALASGIAAAPLAALPFVPHLTGIAILAWLAIGLARWLAPAHYEQGRLVVQPRDLFIYLGLAWWAMPLFQLILTALGAPHVTPNPVTSWIGLAVVIAVLVALTISLIDKQGRRGDQQSRAQKILMPALVAASVAHTIFLIWFAFQRSGPDFWIHFRAVRSFALNGSPLYDVGGIAANHFGFSYKWPPFYVVLLRPFVTFDGLSVLLGHRVVNTLLLATTALLLLRQSRSWTTAAVVVLLFNFRPATDTIAFGQVDILMLAGFTIALLALMRGKDDITGAVVAVLTVIKIYPGLLFVFFILQRRWRAFRGAIIAGLLCTAVSVAVFGWPTHWLYLTQVTPIMGQGGGGTAWIENQTFNGFLSRFVASNYVADPFSNPAVTIATYLFFGLTLVIAALAALLFAPAGPEQNPEGAIHPEKPLRLWKWPGNDWSAPLPLQFSLMVLLLLIAVPAAWMHYHTVAILCFAALVLHDNKAWPLGQAIMLAAAYALVAYGNQYSFADTAIAEGLGILGYSYKFYGLMLLFVVMVARLVACHADCAGWWRWGTLYGCPPGAPVQPASSASNEG